MTHVWRSESNIWELVLSLNDVGVRNWTQVISLIKSSFIHWAISLISPLFVKAHVFQAGLKLIT